MKKILLTALILVLAISAGMAGGTKEPGSVKKLVVATDATWPPMEYVDAKKQIVGFDIDLFKAIAEKGGFQVEFKNTAWDGIFAGLANGQYDAVISSVTITDERRQNFDFSEPYINAGQVLVVRKNSTAKVLTDLTGKQVGAQIGTTGAMEIAKVTSVTLKTYDELPLAMEDLVNGRIEGIVADTPIAADFALQNPNYKGKLKIVGEPFTTEVYGIVVKKGDTATLELINDGLAKVKAAGIDKQLEDKWLR